MTLRIVRLGTPRLTDEGLRIGTVRRPPRGVRKERFAADDWYDVWYPELSPSAPLLASAQQAATPEAWAAFEKAFRREMAEAAPSHALDLLAALSHRTDLSIGCYCAEESRCHRSILRGLLADRGAKLA